MAQVPRALGRRSRYRAECPPPTQASSKLLTGAASINVTNQNILSRQPQPRLSIISQASQLALGKHNKDKQARCRFIKLLVQVEGWGPPGGHWWAWSFQVGASSGSPLLFSLLPPATPTPTLRKHLEKEPPSLSGSVCRAFPALLIP